MLSKNTYVDKLDETYYKTMKKKPADIQLGMFIDYVVEHNEKSSKFKVGDHVRISKYKNIFAKCNTPNWSELVFIIKEIKNTVPWTYVFSNLNDEQIVKTFYGKELQKVIQTELKIEKLIKRKGNGLYVK